MLRINLSTQSRERINREQATVLRLYGLSNRWLAQELLQLARDAQADLRLAGYQPRDNVYDPVLAWQLIPELAKRLGVAAFHAQERTDYDVIRASDEDLRLRIACSIGNCGTRALRDSLLTRELANGNPLGFAIDRLVAPGPDDPVARHLREIARFRGVECHDGRWSPAFMDSRQGGTPAMSDAEPPALGR